MTKLSPLPPRPSDPDDNRNDLLIVIAILTGCVIAIALVVFL